MSFIDVIKERAKSEKKKIVLPETGDPRTLEADLFSFFPSSDAKEVK